MPECIHGLEFGLCDICSPKAAPVAPPRTPPVSRAPRTSTTVRRESPARASGRAALDLARTRVFHITHVDNLIGIADEGALVAGATPLVDISGEGVRAARSVRTAEGRPVTEYVTFLPTIESSLWSGLRAGAHDPRLALPPGAVAGDFVILAATLDALDGFVVADGDAAHPLTRFSGDRETRVRMLGVAAADQTGRGLDAEVLVPDRVPLSSIVVITVGNDRAKRAAADALASGGFRTRVAVHPPWFQTEVDAQPR